MARQGLLDRNPCAFLNESGKYYVALPENNENIDDITKLLANSEVYGKVITAKFGRSGGQLAPDGSADAVLTFRNLHNWIKDGYQEQALAAIYKALKPGGILGIEDHRGLPDRPQKLQTKDGYVKEQYAIDLAKRAGFEFIASSPINNNPKDTKIWPKGVWTLPPSLKLGDKDRAKYEAIGEADNFVLLFKKSVEFIPGE